MSKQFEKETQRKLEEKQLRRNVELNKGLVERQEMEIGNTKDSFAFLDTTWFSLSIRKIVKKGYCKSFIVTLADPLPKEEVKKRLRKVFG